MAASELKRDHLTGYCLFGIDGASDVSMLPTSHSDGTGDLIGSGPCAINSFARGSDGNDYILKGNDTWIVYTGKTRDFDIDW